MKAGGVSCICSVAVKDRSAELLGTGSGFGQALRAAMEGTAAVCAGEARSRAPVKSGRLRASIGYTVGEDGSGNLAAAVGTDVPYAAAQEFGTARRPGKHFLADGMAAGARSLM